MADKLKSMVALAPKRRGRPRQYEVGSKQIQVMIPQDLRQAAEQHARNRRLAGLSDAVRDLLREAAEARRLVKPRED